MAGKIKTWFEKFSQAGQEGKDKPKKVTDPFCNMKIEPGIITSEYNGKIYYFCAENCKTEFNINPAQYI